MAFLAPLASTANIWGPAALSLLAGRIGAGAEAGRAKQLRDMLTKLLSPESIGNEANSLFDVFRRSPMYTNLRTQGMIGAQTLAQRISANAQRAGLGTTGIAAASVPLAQSSFQNTFANIDSSLFSRALEEARSNLMAKAGIYERTQTPGAWAGGIGRGLESYLPYLYKMLSQSGGMLNLNAGLDPTNTR